MAFVKQAVFWLLAGVVIALAVANRGVVPFRLDPLPYAFEAPLYLLLFLVFLAGLVVGSFASYKSARRRLRTAQRRNSSAAHRVSAVSVAPAGKEGQSALSKEPVLSGNNPTDKPRARP